MTFLSDFIAYPLPPGLKILFLLFPSGPAFAPVYFHGSHDWRDIKQHGKMPGKSPLAAPLIENAYGFDFRRDYQFARENIRPVMRAKGPTWIASLSYALENRSAR